MENELVRVCGVGLICAVGALILKGISSQSVFAIRIFGVVSLIGAAAAIMGTVLAQSYALVDSETIGEYSARMMKALGLAMISGISADICRDCGEGSIATGIETVGNLCILWLCVPLFSELVGYARALLEMG